jgi:hypothetical protein
MASIKMITIKDEVEKVIKGVPIVPSSLSKKLIHPSTGGEIFFIDKTQGIQMGLMSKMNFKNICPIAQNMCEITIKIERV